MAPTIIKKKLCENKAHKLREEDKGEKYGCDGCKTNGKGRKYICETCKGHFHHECIDSKPKFCPEMFKEEKGSYEFEYSRSVPPPRPRKSGKRKKNCPDSRNCEACGMRVEGYAYRCNKTDKDLHPRCAFLDKEIVVPLPDDDQVKLVLSRKGQVTLNSDINDCCSICQRAELPAAAGVDEKVPGWTYISDDGKISFHVFCMLQIWFKNSTAKNGGPKLLGKLERQQSTAETQDIKYSKKKQEGGPGEAVTKVTIKQNTGPKLQVKESNKNGYRGTSIRDNSKKKGGVRDGGRGNAAKENGNNAKMELVKHDLRDQIQHHHSKQKKKKGLWGGRKSKCCMKILVKVLSVVFSALIGDVTDLAGSVALEAGKFVFDNLA